MRCIVFFLVCIGVCLANNFYPATITDITNVHSTDQPISVLSVQDQANKNDNWAKYIEFTCSTAAPYSGIFTFSVGDISAAAATLTVNFRGQPFSAQQWIFEVATSSSSGWVRIGDTSADTKGWNAWTVMSFAIPNSELSRMVVHGQVQIRFSAVTGIDAGQLDFMQLAITPGSSNPSTPPPATTEPPATNPPTTTPTNPPSTNPPTDPPTDPPTPPTDPPTNAPTNPPTHAPTSPPTNPPTNSPTAPPSGGMQCHLRVLVLSAAKTAANGLDFVNLTLNSVGLPFDFMIVTASTPLASILPTSGVGPYSAIISVKKTLLSAAQQQAVIAYQLHFGVRWAIVASTPAGLPGLTAGTATSVKGTLTIAPDFVSYATPLQPTLSIDTQYCIPWSAKDPATLTPGTITDTTAVTPALLYNGNKVAAADVAFPDGTHQFHYFITQSADYFHSRLFGPILLNWISPGGIFVGFHQVTLIVQPDDLFMASNLWDVNTHKNPLSNDLTYRITPADLQETADYLNALNPTLPTGSYVTIEWPYNGAGTTWYTQPDTLFAKAVELRDVFYFVSHTWSHPCDFDTATYASVNTELSNNINWTPSFLPGGMANPRLSNQSLVNPCITGLFNGNCLRAMWDNGIRYAVGDNSVKKLVPDNLWHPIITTQATHGFAGILIIPREAYDIDYDNSVPAEFVDQYNTENNVHYTFEQLMQQELDYFMLRKTAFQHDAIMFHQVNLRHFSYNDPVDGATRRTSLTTLWMDRVIRQIRAWYNLPIWSPKFPQAAKIFLDRKTRDECGADIIYSISNNQITGLTLSAASNCELPLSGVSLSGASVRIETHGSETTSFISLHAGQAQYFAISPPIAMHHAEGTRVRRERSMAEVRERKRAERRSWMGGNRDEL